MRFISPGHSEVFVEIENRDGKIVRVLFDSWLSDFAFGDFLQRNPGQINLERLPPIDAIYISHPHCDHLDPYTLVELYKLQSPLLVIPQTIEFVTPLFEKYLPIKSEQIRILRHNQTIQLLGLNWTGFCHSLPYLTNEDDVMALMLSSPTEAVMLEADAASPDDPSAQEIVYKKFADKKLKSRAVVSTRNELEALYASYDARNPKERLSALSSYKKKRQAELSWEYERFAELDMPSIWGLPNMTRIICGQGMTFPIEASPLHATVSAPMPLREITAIERAAAKHAGFRAKIETLEAGESLSGAQRSRCDWLQMIQSNISFEREGAATPKIKPGPVTDEPRNAEEQSAFILKLLNDRFLPYQTYHREEPLKTILLRTQKPDYTIRVKFGTMSNNVSKDFAYGFKRQQFELTEQQTQPDEIYWANDLDDFYHGTQDQFSTTLHSFEPNTSYRFWSMLGMPFLNSDLVYRKIEVHFVRAAKGESVNDFVLDRVRRKI